MEDVTPLHRVALPTSLALGKSRGAVSSIEESDRGKKRSRYSTLPENLDEALGLINRELEQACQSRGEIRDLGRKIEMLEQELKMVKGRAELLERDKFKGNSGDEEEVRRLREENAVLRAELNRKAEEWERWRSSMKAFVDGK